MRSTSSSSRLPSASTIAARPVEILAVLQDVSRHCEWAPNCTEAMLVEQVSPTSRYTYSRTRPPRPASARDVVLLTEFWVSAGGQQVRSAFEASPHSSRPPVKGVVRITRLHGHYALRAIDRTQTSVDYQVSSDPGGSIPGWVLAEHGARIPLDTLWSLRAQVRRTRGEYAAFVAKWE